MEYLTNEVGARRIQARCDTRNPYSAKVMEKCGLKYEGTAIQAEWNNSGAGNVAGYGLVVGPVVAEEPEETLRSVIGRIRESWYEKTREMLLFFYYPSDEYISYLMTVEELEFLDEIDCQDLFDGKNPRERILVFQMGEE